jgi:anti-sigma regulatory factor (Ser/Thr protein kinase)
MSVATVTDGPLPAAGSFMHHALFYRDAPDYLAATVPFVLRGLRLGEPVLVAVPGANLRLLSAELGRSAAKVRLLDMTVVGRNPGRIIPGVLREFADGHPGGRVRIIGEPIWPGRDDHEYPACVQHEALINLAFADRPVTVVCPYDAQSLKPEVLEDAAATHPVLVDEAGQRASSDYDVDRILRVCNMPLPEPATPPAELHFDAANMGRTRTMAVELAVRAGVGRDRAIDVELAVSELAANTLMYGGGSGRLRIWTESRRLVCEVLDAGHITDPLVGRRPVDPDVPGRRGVLVVNHLADLVRMHTGPDGTAMRAYFAR